MTSSYADGYEDSLRQQQLDEQRRLEEGERIADRIANTQYQVGVDLRRLMQMLQMIEKMQVLIDH